ncbi:MAG TPA: hypothetical protein VKR06_03700, partial [Ktedonosporobacter sp.]|nr:hypothetical protein [Ktedonosporobacter sp.]
MVKKQEEGQPYQQEHQTRCPRTATVANQKPKPKSDPPTLNHPSRDAIGTPITTSMVPTRANVFPILPMGSLFRGFEVNARFSLFVCSDRENAC